MVTFPLLLTIGHRIAGSGWDLISRQTVWAACTTAFFSSACLGELLSYCAHAHDPSADLLWRDVLFHSPTAATPTAATPTHHPSPSDHAKIMSLSLAVLNSNPTDVPGAPDDCLQLLHPGRFLAGAVCDAGQLWLAAKAAIGPSGLVPLSSYDMEAIGLSGWVTARDGTNYTTPLPPASP